MDIDKLTIGEAKEVAQQFSHLAQPQPIKLNHPMLNRRVLIRTYSAGVHIGDLVQIDGMEGKLENALRLWQ